MHHIEPIELSESITNLLDGLDDERVTINQLIDHFGPRSYGVLIVVLTIPGLLPGIASLAGLVLLVFSLQMVLGISRPWLPGQLGELKIRRSGLAQGITLILPYVKKVEKYFHPRFVLLQGAIAMRVLGLVIALMSFLIVFPVPFSNFIPSVILLFLGLALLQEDGLIALLSSLFAALYALVFSLLFYKVMLKLLA